MRIKILGCGYLGFNINEVLKTSFDCEILGLKNYYSDKTNNFRELDLFNKENLLNEDFDDCIIIDCISLVSNTENNLDKLNFVKEKYEILFNVLKNKNIKRFIMLSSGGTIYGDCYEPINESHPLNPQSVYAKSKYMLENMLKSTGIDYLILRPTNPYGGIFEPNKTQGVIDILVKSALENKKFYLWADESSVRDYIYIDDFTNAIKKLIDFDINNEIINISSKSGTSIKEVIKYVEHYSGKKIEIEKSNINVPIIKSIVLSNDKLKKLTDFNINFDIKKGIELEVLKLKEDLK